MNVHTSSLTGSALAGRSRSARACPVTIAYGDGIGPEIMEASLRVLEAGGAALAPERIELGEAVYKAGHSSGIAPQSWDSLRRTGVLYKAPITTPQGGGYKSLNVTIRKSLGLFANVRPCAALHPFVSTRHPGMDVVIVRENEEDLYAGIEHRQTDEVYQCLKLVSRPGTERIVRYAFEYARANGRKSVACFSKDNIMKLTDGLFHRVFREIAAEYPDIESRHWIVDIGTAKLAADPGQFDVIVTSNLYGDIISDVAAEIAGSVGLGASANIGEQVAMFEAIHGSAPDLAGRDVANPSGLLLAGVQMLSHLGQGEAATRIHNAWLKTIEDGVHTRDVFDAGRSQACVGTQAFADAVIARMGQCPVTLDAVHYAADARPVAVPAAVRRAPQHKVCSGVDVFVHAAGATPDALASLLQEVSSSSPLELTLITNRGVAVWPKGQPETFKTDHWRCRFERTGQASRAEVAGLIQSLAVADIDFIKTEMLFTFDGEPGYSLGQGQ